MNILVLGGTYFLGKAFIKQCLIAGAKLEAGADFETENIITVFNRGNRPLNLENMKREITTLQCKLEKDISEVSCDSNDEFTVKEVQGDRHSIVDLCKLKSEANYDVVVDFCAYSKGDIAQVFDALGDSISQYIFISTSDVYERGLNSVLDENAPFVTRDFGGEAGDYITGKVALEKELVECATRYGVSYTSIRPAFIYGPDNYAPREGIFFNWIVQAGQILFPEDADGEFQMVFVDDVAKAIFAAMRNENAYNKAFNLAPNEHVTYESFAKALEEAVPVPFEKVPVTVEFVNSNQIPLPFPLTKAESNLYDGEKAIELIDSYTDLAIGLKKCWDKYMQGHR